MATSALPSSRSVRHGERSSLTPKAGACETMVIAFNGMALMTRLRAYRNGQEALTAYDTPYSECRQYWLPGTDIPNVPASLGTAMLYHCWTSA